MEKAGLTNAYTLLDGRRRGANLTGAMAKVLPNHHLTLAEREQTTTLLR